MILKALDMDPIGMTFLRRFSSIMFYKLMCFLMQLLKLTKILIDGYIVISFCIHLTSAKDMFSI